MTLALFDNGKLDMHTTRCRSGWTWSKVCIGEFDEALNPDWGHVYVDGAVCAYCTQPLTRWKYRHSEWRPSEWVCVSWRRYVIFEEDLT